MNPTALVIPVIAPAGLMPEGSGIVRPRDMNVVKVPLRAKEAP